LAAIVCDDANFETHLKDEGPILIDFWSPRYGRCENLDPLIDAIAREYLGQLKTLKVDVNDAPKTTERFKVDSIPTVLILKQGRVRARLAGVRTNLELVHALVPHLAASH
jgi:thioredoxin-like negative regulator of GroEL